MRNLFGSVLIILLIPAIFVACSPSAQLKTVTFESPLADVQAADVTIEIPFQRVAVNALSGRENLMSGRVQVIGDLDFNVDGDDARRILSLGEDSGNQSYAGDEEAEWTIGLTAQIPLRLNYIMNAGTSTLDLRGVKLDDFALTMFTGDLTAILPATNNGYNVNVDMRSGSGSVNLPEDFDTHMRVNVGSGELRVTVGAESGGTVDVDMTTGEVIFSVPETIGVRVEMGELSSGNIVVPASLMLISGSASANGVWESAGYEDNAYQMVFRIAMQNGRFIIQN
ncbi:MAG: hypothetical protein RLP44_24055 [Aggregatilineales bacterium]